MAHHATNTFPVIGSRIAEVFCQISGSLPPMSFLTIFLYSVASTGSPVHFFKTCPGYPGVSCSFGSFPMYFRYVSRILSTNFGIVAFPLVPSSKMLFQFAVISILEPGAYHFLVPINSLWLSYHKCVVGMQQCQQHHNILFVS